MTIPIAANVEITGAGANIGSWWKQAIELGVQTVNDNGGVKVGGKTYKFKADIQDNRTDPQTAITITQRFVDQGDKFIFGPGFSSLFPPAFQSLQGASAVVFTPSATALGFLSKPEGKNLFVTKGTDTAAIEAAVAATVAKYQPKTVAFLESNDAAGELHKAAFMKAFANHGLKVVYQDSFDPKTTDFAPYVAKIKAKSPDMVVMGYNDQWARPFFEQAVAQRFTTPVFLGAPGVDSAAIQGLDQIHRVALATPTRSLSNTSDPAAATFNTEYQKAFGKPAGENSFWTLIYYDSVVMLAKAMEVAKTTTDLDAIGKAMTTSAATQYPGRVMDLSYDAQHQSHYTAQTQFVDDGKVSYSEGDTTK
jgi:branched-chain amino acid transport system substrate-binding protein